MMSATNNNIPPPPDLPSRYESFPAPITDIAVSG